MGLRCDPIKIGVRLTPSVVLVLTGERIEAIVRLNHHLETMAMTARVRCGEAWGKESRRASPKKLSEL